MEYIGSWPIPWMVSILNTLAVPNAFAWWDYFCKNLFARQGWETDEGQTLSQFFPWHSIRKVEEKQPPFFLSLPCSIKLPLRGGKQQTRLFFFTLRGKYLTLRLSLKGQASPNLMETPFRIHTSRAILGSVQLSSVTITFPRPGGGIWAPEV